MVKTYLYNVEFKKNKGLSHIHLSFYIQDKFRKVSEIDNVIFSENPDSKDETFFIFL